MSDKQLFLNGLSLLPGEKQSVAISIGGDPALLFAATAPLLPDIDPLILACAISRRRVELVRCKTSEVEVPANAEIVLEGVAEGIHAPGEFQLAGSDGNLNPLANLSLFRPTMLTSRKNPLLVAALPQSAETSWHVRAAERLLLPLLKRILPEITDLAFPVEKAFYGLAIVSIRKTYPGQAQRVMYNLWGIERLRFLRHILVVDDSCDIRQATGLLPHIINQLDPTRDLLIVKGPLEGNRVGSKVGFDATHKLPQEGGVIQPTSALTKTGEDIEQLVAEKWLEYGIE